ncbi:hypothetical protein yc1106_03417 [Curvularia clavata]|uniref:Uncharacterized protein n=1 Tax=Curvularia clavata TaxID=95742 RepID=A0A9Q8Z980_CURCL|nr:hypothetical protein yc1106_03417 [Curvularia clavata]
MPYPEDVHTPPSTPPPRKCGLKWADFQHQGDLNITNTATQRQKLQTPLDRTVARLREERFRFMAKVPNDLNSKTCCPRDRSAVLQIYTEALDPEKINCKNHEEIYAEAHAKIRIILSIASAGPRNDVFYKGLLSPIEPLYARPRIEFRKDKYSHRAATRIQEWRNDGWPYRYPKNAIEAEKVRKGQLKRWYEEDWTDWTVGGLDEEKEEEGEDAAKDEDENEMEWMSSQG